MGLPAAVNSEGVVVELGLMSGCQVEVLSFPSRHRFDNGSNTLKIGYVEFNQTR